MKCQLYLRVLRGPIPGYKYLDDTDPGKGFSTTNLAANYKIGLTLRALSLTRILPLKPSILNANWNWGWKDTDSSTW